MRESKHILPNSQLKVKHILFNVDLRRELSLKKIQMAYSIFTCGIRFYTYTQKCYFKDVNWLLQTGYIYWLLKTIKLDLNAQY